MRATPTQLRTLKDLAKRDGTMHAVRCDRPVDWIESPRYGLIDEPTAYGETLKVASSTVRVLRSKGWLRWSDDCSKFVITAAGRREAAR
jgi:hypothetical protein